MIKDYYTNHLRQVFNDTFLVIFTINLNFKYLGTQRRKRRNIRFITELNYAIDKV